MPSSFARTFRSIDADSGGGSRLVLLGAIVVLAAWGVWFALARMSVYVASDTAQLEVVGATYAVDAPVSGRVIDMNVALDGEVHEGDVLVVLDSESQRLQLAEATARADGIAPQLEAARQKLHAEERALDDLANQSHTNGEDRRTRVAELSREASRLDADVGAARANIDTIRHDIDRRSIRAPATGRLGEIGFVRLGSVLKEGDRVGTIVASGPLRVVAQLPPASALGRVKAGQLARVRLEGFPWTEFGDVTGRVTDVASEVRENHARVELLILSHSPLIPLQHGMPASVEIEIEKATPVQLVLRAAGQLVARTKSEPPPAGPPAIAGGG